MIHQSEALLEPAEPRRPRPADIVVGIPVAPNDTSAAQVAADLTGRLQRLFPSRAAQVLFLARHGAHGEVEALPAPDGPPAAGAGAAAPLERPSPPSGGFLGPASALPALLREVRRLDAPLCVLIAPEPHDDGADWVRLLVAPVLEQGYDFVRPSYLRGKLEGTLNKGLIYPLIRALYGKRLHQPLGGELALSRKLAEALLEDEEWQTDPVYAGADLWLVTKVLSRGFRVCQSFLGRTSWRGPEQAEELPDTLARVIGLLFHDMERHAAVWQRVSGSEPVPTLGSPGAADSGHSSADVSGMVDAFELGYRDLHELWAHVLPPATMLSLQRISGKPAAAFRMSDELWARLIFDFALAWHMRLMERTQLLRSMTPVYLGWLAGFVNEVRDLDGPQTEARIEQLCRTFEQTKPYLISRWRWPDRFNP